MRRTPASSRVRVVGEGRRKEGEGREGGREREREKERERERETERDVPNR